MYVCCLLPLNIYIVLLFRTTTVHPQRPQLQIVCEDSPIDTKFWPATRAHAQAYVCRLRRIIHRMSWKTNTPRLPGRRRPRCSCTFRKLRSCFVVTWGRPPRPSARCLAYSWGAHERERAGGRGAYVVTVWQASGDQYQSRFE